MEIAYVREVPDTINDCPLTFLDRQVIDIDLVRAQHSQYVELLRGLGVEVRYLPTTDGLTDSVFVEDTALVLDELTIMTRPGATSRRPEVDSAADTPCRHIAGSNGLRRLSPWMVATSRWLGSRSTSGAPLAPMMLPWMR